MAEVSATKPRLLKHMLTHGDVYLIDGHKCGNEAEPLLICFHGSGESHMESWQDLIMLLSENHHVTFYERHFDRTTPKEHASSLHEFLVSFRHEKSYFLVAHSYGGVLARQFLKDHPKLVTGVVLVETGKGSNDLHKLDAYLIKHKSLAGKPLSVIHGNSLIRQQQALEAMQKSLTAENREELEPQQRLLATAMQHDEEHERAQLLLSSNNRYVRLSGCGHNIVRDRPDIVVQEVDWVCQNVVVNCHDISWFRRLFNWA